MSETASRFVRCVRTHEHRLHDREAQHDHRDRPGPTRPAQALAADFHRCFARFTAAPDLFAPDAFYDLLPPLWRFQFEGPGAAFCEQLRSIAEGPVEIQVVRTLPTVPDSSRNTSRRSTRPTVTSSPAGLHVCEVRDGGICAVTTYCNGGWNDELRARHAAEAPMAPTLTGAASILRRGRMP